MTEEQQSTNMPHTCTCTQGWREGGVGKGEREGRREREKGDERGMSHSLLVGWMTAGEMPGIWVGVCEWEDWIKG